MLLIIAVAAVGYFDVYPEYVSAFFQNPRGDG